jgi:SAM-dependent methyltransferase
MPHRPDGINCSALLCHHPGPRDKEKDGKSKGLATDLPLAADLSGRHNSIFTRRENAKMPATDRLGEEIAFHDRQAAERAGRFATADLLFSDEHYLDHESWIRPAFARLGEVQSRALLDLGCGHGMASVVLARMGATVTALDLSAGYLAEAGCRARANGVEISLVQADAERLPFADGTFDRIWGNAVLHHLDVGRAAREVYRVLRPGGIAVFSEPWGDNPLLEWARRHLPYPGKERTRDERPLRGEQLPQLQAVFPRLQIEGYQLLSMARRVLGKGLLSRGLAWCDDRLLARAPSLSRLCRYVVLTLPRNEYNNQGE